jgi:hypothetical protein
MNHARICQARPYPPRGRRGHGWCVFDAPFWPLLSLYTDGKLLRTPGLSLAAGGWTPQLEGDKTALNDVGLVLAYRANR